MGKIITTSMVAVALIMLIVTVADADKYKAPVTVEAGGRTIDATLEKSQNSTEIRDTQVGNIKLEYDKIKKFTFIKYRGDYWHTVEVTLNNEDVLKGRMYDDWIGRIKSDIYGEIRITKYPTTLYIGGKSTEGTTQESQMRAFPLGDGGVKVHYDLSDGGYLGCSYWKSTGERVDLNSQHVVGKSFVIFNVPESCSYTVALWKEKYNYGEGPEPNNSWGKQNGYYLYKELNRVDGTNK